MDNEKISLTIGAVLKGNKDYHIMGVLGQGGFGITYLAQATVMDGQIPQTHRYTIKEFYVKDLCQRSIDGSITAMTASKATYNEYKAAFLKEAQLLKSLGNHQGIVPVNEVFETNGTIYYVMQYLGDETLKDYVANHGGKLTEDEASRIVIAMADALQHLHENKMTHLDVKPDNVMMCPDGDGVKQPVLIDFGLARHYNKENKMTSVLKISGTSDGYSPIEQYAGIETFSPRADIYALGATFFYMLTGEQPPSANMLLKDKNQSSLRIKLAEVDQKCSQAILDAMKPIEKDRPESIKDFIALLNQNGNVVTSSGTPKKHDPNGTDPISLVGNKERLKGFWSIAALAAVVILALTLFIMWPKQPSVPESGEAEVALADTSESASIQAQDVAEATPVKETAPEKTEKTETNADAKPHKRKIERPEQSAPPAKKVEKPQQSSAGTVNWHGASYTGPLSNGKPDGLGGTLNVVSSCDLGGGKVASAGDRIIDCDFRNGRFVAGKWMKSDGSSEYINIGS